MVMKLGQLSFRKLIEEDLKWLNEQPRTLERQHIEDIVRECEFWHYDLISFLATIIHECGPDSRIGEATYQRLKEIVHRFSGPHGS